MATEAPDTRYARSGAVYIAYQVYGRGPDLVIVPGLFTHLDMVWEQPTVADFYRRLGRFARVIRFDPRGAGLSDRTAELPEFDEQIDDVLAVMDAAGSDRATVLGISQSGPMAILFASSRPERVSGLILYAAYASARRRDGYPWGRSDGWMEEYIRQVSESWGEGTFLPQVAPSVAADPEFRHWWGRFERAMSSPGTALAFLSRYSQVDVRALLPTISTPTLVIQRRHDAHRDVGHARFLAASIPGAELVELEGVDHLPYAGDTEPLLAELERFVTGAAPVADTRGVLATVLFTDIVGSTETLAEVGDEAWRSLLERHHNAVRRQLARFRGQEADTAGDGFLAVFDGPARAIRCAIAITAAVGDLGLRLRVGLHTGEIETVHGHPAGLAVHIGARIAAMADADQILVSSTVRDLVVGSDLAFDDRGVHDLKGIPEPWRVYSVQSAGQPALHPAPPGV